MAHFHLYLLSAFRIHVAARRQIKFRNLDPVLHSSVGRDMNPIGQVRSSRTFQGQSIKRSQIAPPVGYTIMIPFYITKALTTRDEDAYKFPVPQFQLLSLPNRYFSPFSLRDINLQSKHQIS